MVFVKKKEEEKKKKKRRTVDQFGNPIRPNPTPAATPGGSGGGRELDTLRAEEEERKRLALQETGTFKQVGGNLAGETTGIQIEGGRTFFGLNKKDLADLKRLEGLEDVGRLGEERAVVRKEEGRIQEEVKGRGLAEKFGEAGVFERPSLVPLISKEQEDAGVLLNMANALIPSSIKNIGKVFGVGVNIGERFEEAKERVTETEIVLQNIIIDKGLETEIGKEFDKQIKKELTQMGIGIGTVIVGSTIGGFVGSAAQLIGTDKKVKNLTTGITALQAIGTDMATTVLSGDMSVDDGLDKIVEIEAILDNLEAELQLAGIESANVAISLKGRDVSAKILAARTKLNDSKRRMAGAEVAGIITPSPTTQKAAILAGLQAKFEGGS